VKAVAAVLEAWQREAPARAVYTFAALLGVTVYVIAYGPSHVLGTSDYWQVPQQDHRMALMGYRYFLDEPWHWPIFVSDRVNVPYPKSVAFLDCIPIWALINKCIATVIPPWHDLSPRIYLTAWATLSYALQAVFAVAIVRTLGHRSWRNALATALLFLAVPTWIFRYGHPALSAHWIELWAILLYLRRARSGLHWLPLLAIAALTTPYHVVICMPVFVAAMVRMGRRAGMRWIPAGIAWVVLLLWLAGYLFAPETRHPQWGFDFESANLLGWLVPTKSGVFGDMTRFIRIDATGYQYEGYTYLGLGFIGLLALLACRRALDAKQAIRAHKYLFAVLVVFCVVSLSNRVFAGPHEVLSYSIPTFLKWIPNQYRSPGRFVWLPIYVLCCYVVHRGVNRFDHWIVLAFALVQVVDATGDWSQQRALTHGQLAGNEVQWRSLVRAHHRVVMLPSYSCLPGDDLARFYASLQIQWLASEHAMPINGTYAARTHRKCNPEAREWATMALEPDTLYIIYPQATAVLDRFEILGAHCGAFDLGHACSLNREAIGAGWLRPVPPPMHIALGQAVELPDDAAWSTPEENGRWTTQPVASVRVHLDGQASKLTLEARAPLCSKRREQDVEVRVNDFFVATLHFDDASNSPDMIRTITIPAVSGDIALEFSPHDIRSAATLRCGAETRRLGVWISQLSFE
jgi:hypothetical protein